MTEPPDWRDVAARLRRDGNEVLYNFAHDVDVIPFRYVAALIGAQAATIEMLREALKYADSRCGKNHMNCPTALEVRQKICTALAAKPEDGE